MKRLKNYHKQLHLNRANLTAKKEQQQQPFFDYVCVIDFEATCDDVDRNNYPHEIIEFPIVLINLRTMSVEECFQSYVKPVINPDLSKFCVHLTGITQEQVAQADTFPAVLSKVNDWFTQKQLGSNYKFCVASDGPWDFENFLNLQCQHCDVPFPYWAKRWVDVRKLFANWFNVRRCGIEKMLGYLGLEFQGKQHCGLDDAQNIARILMKLISDGCELKLNERLRQCRTRIEKSPFAGEQPCTEDANDEADVDMAE